MKQDSVRQKTSGNPQAGQEIGGLAGLFAMLEKLFRPQRFEQRSNDRWHRSGTVKNRDCSTGGGRRKDILKRRKRNKIASISRRINRKRAA